MSGPYRNLTALSSFSCAARGLALALTTQPNLWLLAAGIWAALLLARWLAVPAGGLATLALALALPLVAELINSALEYSIDLVVGDYHRQARAAKDIAAAGVLAALLAAIVVSVLVLGSPLAWPGAAWAAVTTSPASALAAAAVPSLALISVLVRRRGGLRP